MICIVRLNSRRQSQRIQNRNRSWLTQLQKIYITHLLSIPKAFGDYFVDIKDTDEKKLNSFLGVGKGRVDYALEHAFSYQFPRGERAIFNPIPGQPGARTPEVFLVSFLNA